MSSSCGGVTNRPVSPPIQHSVRIGYPAHQGKTTLVGGSYRTKLDSIGRRTGLDWTGLDRGFVNRFSLPERWSAFVVVVLLQVSSLSLELSQSLGELIRVSTTKDFYYGTPDRNLITLM
jgi:hypothetical protein